MSQTTKSTQHPRREGKFCRSQHVCCNICRAFGSRDQILDQGKILSKCHFEISIIPTTQSCGGKGINLYPCLDAANHRKNSRSCWPEASAFPFPKDPSPGPWSLRYPEDRYFSCWSCARAFTPRECFLPIQTAWRISTSVASPLQTDVSLSRDKLWQQKRACYRWLPDTIPASPRKHRGKQQDWTCHVISIALLGMEMQPFLG